MTNYSDFQNKKDRELIKIIINSSNSPDGIAAKEVLEYRKYQVSKRQNLVIVFLTIVMALTSVINIMLTIIPLETWKLLILN